MSIDGCATLDAGIPTDAFALPDKHDNPVKKPITFCDVSHRMATTLLVEAANGGAIPDKIGAAIMLYKAGFTAGDIVEHIDEVMAELQPHGDAS